MVHELGSEQPQDRRNLPINSTPDLDLPVEDNFDLYDRLAEAHTRESTELARLRLNYSRASTRPGGSSLPIAKPTNPLGRIVYAIKTFWKHQISIVVPHEACRDHLALERTFLGYLRTSLVLSMMGVLVAQLFRVQRAPKPDPRFGFFIIGKPLACICHGAAFGMSAIGAYKSWKFQNAIVRGKAVAGGFEMIMAGVVVLLVLVTFFVLLVAIDIKKERS